MLTRGACLILGLVAGVRAHTFVHSVVRHFLFKHRPLLLSLPIRYQWVNGVDQGSGVGIRQPAYIGAPLPGPTPFNTDQGSGYAKRCIVLSILKYLEPLAIEKESENTI